MTIHVAAGLTSGRAPGYLVLMDATTKIANAEHMYGTDRSRWTLANLKAAVKLGDAKANAELQRRSAK